MELVCVWPKQWVKEKSSLHLWVKNFNFKIYFLTNYFLCSFFDSSFSFDFNDFCLLVRLTTQNINSRQSFDLLLDISSAVWNSYGVWYSRMVYKSFQRFTMVSEFETTHAQLLLLFLCASLGLCAFDRHLVDFQVSFYLTLLIFLIIFFSQELTNKNRTICRLLHRCFYLLFDLFVFISICERTSFFAVLSPNDYFCCLFNFCGNQNISNFS